MNEMVNRQLEYCLALPGDLGTLKDMLMSCVTP